MNKKGFTLIELVGSIIILAALALIAFPAILSVLNSGQKDLDDSIIKFVKSAAESCVNENIDDYNNKCTTVTNLKNNGYISTTFYDKYPDIQNDTITISEENNTYIYTYNEVS